MYRILQVSPAFISSRGMPPLQQSASQIIADTQRYVPVATRDVDNTCHSRTPFYSTRATTEFLNLNLPCGHWATIDNNLHSSLVSIIHNTLNVNRFEVV